MAGEIELTISVDDKGSLKVVGNEAEKASKKLDRVSKSAASADRQLKGAARASSNATKNFSKMSQGITGGLVPAYATLAATLFAVGAAFRFLKDAADVRILLQGQQEFAARTGKALNTLSRELQSATEGQLQFREASQAAAIGQAAGLSTEQITELAKAAKNTSIALGRDLTDSFNRLIRGATKAEPELLDELGIVLRLETATSKYAASIGKSAKELTAFQRTQAVTNDILEQTERKYGDLNVPVNQFNQLAVSISDAINRVKEVIEPFAGFLANVLTNNLTAAVAAVGLFASSIAKGMLPTTKELNKSIRDQKKAIIDLQKGTERRFKAFDRLLGMRNKRIRKSFEVTTKELRSFFDKEDADIGNRKSLSARFLLGEDVDRKKAIKALNQAIGSAKTTFAKTGAFGAESIFSGFSKKGFDAFVREFKKMEEATVGFTEKAAVKFVGMQTGAEKAFAGIRAAWQRTMLAMQTAFTRALKIINFAVWAIGVAGSIFLIIGVVNQLIDYFVPLSEEQKKFNEETTSAVSNFENLAKEIKNVNTEFTDFSSAIMVLGNLANNFNTSNIDILLDPRRIALATENLELQKLTWIDLAAASAKVGAGSAGMSAFGLTPLGPLAGAFATEGANTLMDFYKDKGGESLRGLEQLADSVNIFATTLKEAGAADEVLAPVLSFATALHQFVTGTGDSSNLQELAKGFNQVTQGASSSSAALQGFKDGLVNYQKSLVGTGGGLAFGGIINELNSLDKSLKDVEEKFSSQALGDIKQSFKEFFNLDIEGIGEGRIELNKIMTKYLQFSKDIAKEQRHQKLTQTSINDQLFISTRYNKRIAELYKKEINASKIRELKITKEMHLENLKILKLGTSQRANELLKIAALENEIEILRRGNNLIDKKINLTQKLVKTTQETFESSFTGALESVINATESSLKDLVLNFAQDLGRALSKTLAQNITDFLFDSVRSSKAADGVGLLGQAIGLFFGGGGNNVSVPQGIQKQQLFLETFGTTPKAKGGPVTAGSPYLVGEEGPELMIPRRSGTIIPNSGMGGVQVNVTVNSDGSSQVNTNEQAAAGFGKALGNAVRETISREMGPGGMLSGRR